MKKFLLMLIVTTFSAIAFCQSSVHVNGYFRKNGTYVQPHFRTAPNNTVYDNWSTSGNINPYTGTKGTKSSNYYYIPSYTPKISSRIKW